jgi:alkylation response protein AidB-like acyl-CoA dehydrogenase
MGLHGIQNGLVRFKDVKVPKENILWGLGQGLKLALITLNTGRLTVPAATTSMAKLCLKIVRGWAAERQQWGQEIGRHEAIASKIAAMAATTFAMESVSGLVSAMADEHKVDMRLEAAMSKLFCTEAAWRIADDTVQIRGGRGYETADSLRGRGETPIPAERILRDARINLIIEGTSEIMHLFIAREAMDKHLRLAMPVLSPRTSPGEKAAAAVKAAAHYALWYPALWLLPAGVSADGVPAALKGHLGYVARAGRRLARNLFHAMAVFGPALERRQQVLFRLVNVGTELFAMAATLSRASALRDPGAVTLGDLFCRLARVRIEREWSQLWRNDDARVYAAGIEVLEGKHAWLEKGILDAPFGGRK